MTVTWQVYDTFTEKVIYSQKTKGEYTSKKPEVGLVLGAFSSACRRLLATQGFARALAKDATKKAFAPQLQHEGCRVSNKRLPDGLDDAIDAVVTVRVGSSHGSGFVVSPDGYVLTAAHVVRGTDEVQIRFRGSKKEIAKVVRTDPLHDAAVLKLPGKTYACLALGVAAPALGSDIFVIGSPQSEDLSFSVSRGIFSGERTISDKRSLQTDASVNPGNSGGPMLTADGHVAAIVSWKVSGIGVEGLGFGGPASEAASALGLAPDGDK